MIITLDLAKTYGQQNTDIAKKNKYDNIKITVNAVSENNSNSEESIISFTIDTENTNNENYKVVSAKLENNNYNYDISVGEIYYKTYNVSLDLNSEQYSGLKSAKYVLPYDFQYDGHIYKENNNQQIIQLNSINSFSDIISYWESKELQQNMFNISSNLLTIMSSSITDNYYTITENAEEKNINAIDEVSELIQNGSSVENNFLDLLEYINPEILTWENNGNTLNLTIRVPYLFKIILSGDRWVYSEDYSRAYIGEYNYYEYSYDTFSILLYNDLNIEQNTFSYYNGNRTYSAENSFLFTEGVITNDTDYSVITNNETKESAIYYYNYYDKNFADYVYEKYQNGKIKLEITYPVGTLTTTNGLNVLYSEEYGLVLNIGTKYFDENGNKITINNNDNITSMAQIPEGTLCNIVKNGEQVYTDSNGNPKYFLVQTSNLVYNGILVNELTLIESSEQIVSNFDEMSWAEIDALGSIGELSQYLSVGDIKYIDYSEINENGNVYNYKLPLVILGFNHDALSNGNGYAGMTIGMDTALIRSNYTFNDTLTLPLSWENSSFRTTAIPELFSKLPSDLQSIIKTVNKKSVVDNSDITQYSETADTLFLLSLTEITGSNYIQNDAILSGNYGYGFEEGKQYEYYKTIKDGTTNSGRIKNSQGTDSSYSSPTSWGLRSLQRNNSNIANILSTGEIQHFTVTNDINISFAFCVGEDTSRKLDEYSWNEINTISQSGNAQNLFNIGDTKSDILSTGENVVFEIIGFNNDEIADDSGKMAGITFQCKYALNTDNYITNESLVNWNETYMGNTILPNIFSSLSTELQNVIKNVKYRTGTSITDTSTEIIKEATYTTSNIMLLGSNNIDTTSYNTLIDGVEGSNGIYEYYKGDNLTNRIKTKLDSNSPIKWWLRTPSLNPKIIDGVNAYIYIDETGNINYDAGNKLMGIIFCFSI